MPVAVESDLDRAVAEVRRERLRVHAGRDQNRREGMPALVEADRLQLRSLPLLPGTSDETVSIERPGAVAEEQRSIVAPPELAGGQVRAERRDDRNSPVASTALRLDDAVASIP